MKRIILSSVVILASTSYLSAESYYFTPTIGKVIHESSELNKDTIFGFRAGTAIKPTYGVDTLEVAYDRQSSVDYTSYNQSTNINRFSFNALKHYKYSDVLTPYALAGIGYEHITNHVSYTDNSPFFDLGLGLKYKLPNEISLMTDIRHIVRVEDFDNHTVFNIGLQIPFGTKTVKMLPVAEQKLKLKPNQIKKNLSQ